MPVEVIEFAKIKTESGEEFEGKVTGTNLVEVEVEGEVGVKLCGIPLGVTRKISTKIICDLGSDCTRGKIDEEFHTHPKEISFDDEGKGPGNFIKEVSEVVIASDYKGEKLVFCCYECSSKYYRKAGKYSNVIEFPVGKGTKTFNETGSKVLDDKQEEPE